VNSCEKKKNRAGIAGKGVGDQILLEKGGRGKKGLVRPFGREEVEREGG